MIEDLQTEDSKNISVVAKTSAAEARFDESSSFSPPVPQTPAETTDQVLSDSENAIASTEASVEQIRVPMPPRRAIERNLVCEELALAAADNNLPAPFLIKLINQESGFNQNAISPVGAQGVAQFMPATAAQMQLDDPFNPLKAVRASAQLLRNLLEQFGNKLGLAAAAYNAGPRRVQDWLDKKSKLPDETRNYVERITGRKADEWKANAVAQLRVPAHAPCQRQAGLFAYNGPQTIPLPPPQPGSAAAAEMLVAAKNRKATKPIVVASADATIVPVSTNKPGKKQAKQKLQTLTIAVAAKSAAKRTATSAKPVKSGKKVRVAEARGSK